MITFPFHIGIVVPDVGATMAMWTGTTGAQWAPTRSETRDVWTVDGTQRILFHGTFSVGTDMHLELIAEVPGTLWQAGDGADQLHHIGYWSTDVAADSARLVADGHPIVAAGGGDPTHPEHFAYHRYGAGSFLELLDVAARPLMEQWWAE